jgi:hypothetical protein
MPNHPERGYRRSVAANFYRQHALAIGSLN